jgi:hypothetical protein
MAHDLYASWASAEIASMFGEDASCCFADPPGKVAAFAGRESKVVWPHADGVIGIDHPAFKEAGRKIAVEFKRTNEGIHGVLTAIGQAHAYIHKGYSGAAIVIPQEYETLPDAGGYVKGVFDICESTRRVGVFVYRPPDVTSPTPFRNRIAVVRRMQIDSDAPDESTRSYTGSETQWAHVREGSSTPDAFFRFLQTLKLVSAGVVHATLLELPKELVESAASKGADAEKFLTYTSADDLRDVCWREFWLRYVLTPDVAVPWKVVDGRYEVNGAPSGLRRADGTGQSMFFCGRRDSIKDKIVRELNTLSIDEEKAWELFADNIRKRAHSLREDIDSGLEHVGFVDAGGRITESGFRFLEACERSGDSNGELAQGLLASALLRHGQFAALLHYIHYVSEQAFSRDAAAFQDHGSFDQDAYLEFLESEFVNELRVMRTVSKRGGQARKPFQGELAQLRQLRMVGRFRGGVGLVVNWPKVLEYMEISAG